MLPGYPANTLDKYGLSQRRVEPRPRPPRSGAPPR
jgi:hypothetical protein